MENNTTPHTWDLTGDTSTTDDLTQSMTQEHHTWPHIPLIQGEQVWWPISNVVVTTLIFLGIVLGFAWTARSKLKNSSQWKLKTFVLHFVKFFDDQLRDAFWDKDMSRKYFPLVVGMFCIIFFGNLFGLMIDWVAMSVSPWVANYVRPIHSDINTTLVLALIVVVMMLIIQVQSNGIGRTMKLYAWNAEGNSVGEKGVNVFVWWLHAVWVPATIASLSLRLFGNIFAGIVLIGVISFLTATMTERFFEAGRIMTIPFWFFEVFVALIQAIVFSFLMIAYFKQATQH